MAKVPKVEEEKLIHSVKVSETNNRKLTALAGKLQAIREIKQTPNDAITYLFEISSGRCAISTENLSETKKSKG